MYSGEKRLIGLVLGKRGKLMVGEAEGRVGGWVGGGRVGRRVRLGRKTLDRVDL